MKVLPCYGKTVIVDICEFSVARVHKKSCSALIPLWVSHAYPNSLVDIKPRVPLTTIKKPWCWSFWWSNRSNFALVRAVWDIFAHLLMFVLLRGEVNAKPCQVSFLYCVRTCASAASPQHYPIMISLIRQIPISFLPLDVCSDCMCIQLGVVRDGLPAFIWWALTASRYVCCRWGMEWGSLAARTTAEILICTLGGAGPREALR